MAYVTNKSFVENYMNDIQNIDDVLLNISVIIKLLKKYGKKVKYSSFLNTLEKYDKNLSSFIKSFAKLNKLNVVSLKSIQRLLKQKYPSYTKEYDIFSSNEDFFEDIKSKLENEGNIKANFNKINNDFGLIVSGEGKSSKRTLENDLNKLLK